MEKVYTTTVTLSPTPYEETKTYTKYSLGIGLALGAGKSDWSGDVKILFSGLPSTAKVKKIEITPGRAKINNGDINLKGVVTPTILRITDPAGNVADLKWGTTIVDSSTFAGKFAKGIWYMNMYGTNISRPTGNPTSDLRYFGSVIYSNVEVKITYTLP